MHRLYAASRRPRAFLRSFHASRRGARRVGIDFEVREAGRSCLAGRHLREHLARHVSVSIERNDHVSRGPLARLISGRSAAMGTQTARSHGLLVVPLRARTTRSPGFSSSRRQALLSSFSSDSRGVHRQPARVGSTGPVTPTDRHAPRTSRPSGTAPSRLPSAPFRRGRRRTRRKDPTREARPIATEPRTASRNTRLITSAHATDHLAARGVSASTSK